MPESDHTPLPTFACEHQARQHRVHHKDGRWACDYWACAFCDAHMHLTAVDTPQGRELGLTHYVVSLPPSYGVPHWHADGVVTVVGMAYSSEVGAGSPVTIVPEHRLT